MAKKTYKKKSSARRARPGKRRIQHAIIKKTYKKKSSARRARKKGQSVYKVKGGYRISTGRRAR